MMMTMLPMTRSRTNKIAACSMSKAVVAVDAATAATSVVCRRSKGELGRREHVFTNIRHRCYSNSTVSKNSKSYHHYRSCLSPSCRCYHTAFAACRRNSSSSSLSSITASATIDTTTNTTDYAINKKLFSLAIAAAVSTVTALFASLYNNNNNNLCVFSLSTPTTVYCDKGDDPTTDDDEKEDDDGIDIDMYINNIHADANNTNNTVDTIEEIEEHDVVVQFPFLLYLLDQVKVVKYSEQRDAKTFTSDSGHNKPSGLRGLACIYCTSTSINDNTENDTACCGNSNNNNNNNKGPQQQQQSLHPGQAIFPQDRRSLGYEVMTTLYPHLLHCKHCPTNVKVELQQKYAEHQHYNSMSQQRKHSNYKRRNKKAIKLCHEERIFFKTLWFAMGHKETMMEHRGTGGNNTQYPSSSSSSRPSQREINKIRFVFRS